MVKKPTANAGDIRDVNSIPDPGRSTGGGNGNPLQYSCLENPVDRGAWWATVHSIANSWTQLKRLSKHVQFFRVPSGELTQSLGPCYSILVESSDLSGEFSFTLALS